MRWLTGILLAIGLLLAAAPAAAGQAPCTTDDDCPEPQICLEGTCGLRECTIHWDCEQGEFCYKGYCLRDAAPVWHCGKAGCPPGMQCIDANNTRSRCAEDPNYYCTTACDCGPAHCCKDNKCVKDPADPWLPGGEPLPGLSCERGVDATYCCEAADCHAGRMSYGDGLSLFGCYQSASGEVVRYCGGAACYATATNCAPGQACVDTIAQTTPPGKACWLTVGGACVSNALAEAVFGWPANELIPPAPGYPGYPEYDAGWQTGVDGRFAYERVVGATGAVCGNAVCEAGEYPGTCPADCTCGDGVCHPVEAGSCEADCGACGDGSCAAWESPRTCAVDCPATAADRWCELDESWSNPADCPCPDGAYYPGIYAICGDAYCQDGGGAGPETCWNCAADCGACPAVAAAEGGPLFTGVFGGSEGSLVHEFAPDIARSIVRHGDALYVAGQTYAVDFPSTDGPAKSSVAWDAFVTRLGLDGSLVWATYLGDAGGPAGHTARDVAVDGAGRVYVTGSLGVAVLDANGNLLRSIGFAAGEDGYAIGVDAAGNIYVAGSPALGVRKYDADGNLAYQSTAAGGPFYDLVIDGEGNVYLATATGMTKLGPTGTVLFTTDLRGVAFGIALHGQRIVVAGQTRASDFPATAGALQPSAAGAGDAFVAVLNAAGEVLYGTYLGGSNMDAAYAVALDAEGQIYVTGITYSTDFPSAPGAAASDGTGTLFAAQLSPNGGGAGDLAQVVRLGGGAPVLPPYFTPGRGFGLAMGDGCTFYVAGEAGSGALAQGGFTQALVASFSAADRTAPSVSATVAKSELWPANHRMVDVGLRMAATDTCDPAPGIVIAVTSDEPVALAAAPNAAISAPDAQVTSDGRVLLRAERLGTGDGRVYRIAVMATDAGGNAATSAVTVSVRHDVASPAVNSGQLYDATQAASTSAGAGAAQGNPPVFLPAIVR